MKTYAILDVWGCTNSHNMDIFCEKSYRSQAVGFLKKLEIFFPISWKIDGNTQIFPTRGFGEIFPVNACNFRKMGKGICHSKEKLWENINIQKLRFS